MLEYLTTLSLMLLIVTNGMLVRGCFRIRDAIPAQGGEIAGRFDKTNDLLDELAQLIADLSDGAGGGVPATAQTPGGFGDLLTMFLNNRMNMQRPDAGTTEQEWEILQANDDPTPQKQF
jgi:hypothetical protein